MIAWLLKELEKNPTTIFYKRDLLKQSKKHFEELQRLKVLTYVQPDPNRETYPCSLPCANACPMDIVEIEGKQYAICPQGNEINPIPLEGDALEQYEFSIERFLERIRAVNSFDGTLQKIEQDLFYLGHTTYDGSRVGFVFGFTCAHKGVLELTGLKRFCADDDYLVVFSPVSVIENVSVKRELGHEGIVQTSFGSSLNFQTYQLSLGKLLSGLIAQKAAEMERKNITGRRKRGRKKDPKIKMRNRQIAEFKANNPGKTYKEIGQEFNVSAEVVRKACNNPDN